jgi:transcriptional regulator with XRE-family HTH domain
MSAPSVLRVNAAEERAAYRKAVARVITCIQAEHGVTHIDIAEKIGVSLGTISNAANKNTDLCHTYLDRLGKAYGCHALDPVHALYGARAVPLVADDSLDALPSTTAAIHKLALARSPNSPGGDRITHGELLDMEADIDAALKALTSLKVKCSLIRSAA